MYKIILTVVFFLLTLATPVYAQTPTETSTPSAKPTPMYVLPYPGILPDNPLYKIKVARDLLVESLISDPKKKVEFYLIQTDKQLGMVTTLVDKGEIELAKQTAYKGEHNYTKLTYVYKNANTKPTAEVADRLLRAAAAHQDLLRQVISKVGKEDKKAFEQVLNFSITNKEEIERIVGKRNVQTKDTEKVDEDATEK